MIAAIYCRKSTEQAVAAEMKSVVRQEENARAFAVKNGWSVCDVFVDDGISGAEFAKRPGFQRMLAASRERRYAILIVSEQKSIGREMSETAYVIKQLALDGVEVFEYVHGRSLTPKTWMDKVMSAVQSGADEAHRVASAERIHEAQSRLARNGYVCGGRTYGYRNVTVTNGVDAWGYPLRSHVDRVPEPAEAAVVLQIYQLFDSGLGLKNIAKRLTSEKAPPPRPYHRKDGSLPKPGWAPSTVRAILMRDIYRGAPTWNQRKKRNAWGQQAEEARPESEWQRATREDLRIVPEDLWARVAARRKETEGHVLRFDSGRMAGRPTKSAVVNLLAGMAQCSECGGGMVVEQGGGAAK
jgi:site-specific DNA recombinase